MTDKPVIVWFRRDLRLDDNPALAAAAALGRPVAPVFILDDKAAFAPGGAARWWLDRSLASLGADLSALGAPLILQRGQETEALIGLARTLGAAAVYWNRRYAPAEVEVDRRLMETLKAAGVETRSFNASLLREPWELKTASGTPFRVFSPMWRALQAEGPARTALAARPSRLEPAAAPPSDDLKTWRLSPVAPDWASEFSDEWRPGEAGAAARLDRFLDGPANRYDRERDRPDIEATSRLSPHLAFGEIGPLQIWRTVRARIDAGALAAGPGGKFLSEVAWREFAYSLLYHADDLAGAPIRPEFASFPWSENKERLEVWRRGGTGYPIVDAGMRQLWRTGWMHNRVRMIVASFLVKHLLIPWQDGERWFWDTLLDADPANNAASWQWVAGCGADAAPYFRIFNPISQGEKFDPEGAFVRRFVPELARMPQSYLNRPWEAPASVAVAAGVRLGADYPLPIVDHATARDEALAAFESIRKRD